MNAPRKPGFEEQMKRLQAIVSELENNDIELEKSLALYKEGVELARACRERLKTARQEVSLLAEGIFTPFKESDNEFGNDEEEA
ncbi:MAG: exodeoxyribonuclease VII small subunit [Desulfovibrionaceae bacterium]|nr:exodeoxyribonuclease VII small subunit [Desulfovibrionaceae bacterium]